jgi:hypothetical protein
MGQPSPAVSRSNAPLFFSCASVLARAAVCGPLQGEQNASASVWRVLQPRKAAAAFVALLHERGVRAYIKGVELCFELCSTGQLSAAVPTWLPGKRRGAGSPSCNLLVRRPKPTLGCFGQRGRVGQLPYPHRHHHSRDSAHDHAHAHQGANRPGGAGWPVETDEQRQ